MLYKNKERFKRLPTLLLSAAIASAASQASYAGGNGGNDDLERQVEELQRQVKMLMRQINKNKVAVQDLGEKVSSAPAAASGKGKTFGGDKANFRLGNTDVSIGGFVKLDMQFSEYSDGSAALAGIGEDFLVPSVIPVGGEGGDVKFHAHAKTSRFNIKTMTKTETGHVKTFFEFDAIGSAQGDERISNSSAERMRHAFVDWNIDGTHSILAGQTWSTFFNVGTLPESLDFVGPVGTIFERQPQLRYTAKLNGGSSFMLAAENPATTLYGASKNPVDDNSMPDIVARYNGKAGDFSYSLAAMSRELKYEAGSKDYRKMGYALSAAAKYKMTSDEIRFMVNYGDALGRYMGLNGFRSGMIRSDGEIELIDAWGAFVNWKHHWSNKWRSNLTLSMAAADNPVDLGSGVAAEYTSVHANLLYSPVKSLTLGGEYIYATKELENINNALADDKGSLNRLLFSVKYAF
ncbi:MAG: porin [Cellvibrionaceae bacterium]|nr:porin [Cellvibrionaceae bacterium]